MGEMGENKNRKSKKSEGKTNEILRKIQDMTNQIEIKVEEGKWNVNSILLDLFINSKREIKTVFRSKITKEHNYKFKNH